MLRVLLASLTPHPLPASLPPRSGWLPRQAMLRLRLSSVSGFPLTCLNIRIPYPRSREPMGPPKFLMLLFLHARRSDPDRPSGISPCPYLRAMFVFSVLCLVSRQCHSISPIVSTLDSSVLASSKITLSPSALLSLTRLKSLQGGASPLWPTRFSVYASPLLFTFATVSLPFTTLSARGATLDTGGWLALTRDHPDPSPDRDLHPARSAKLRLAHQPWVL